MRLLIFLLLVLIIWIGFSISAKDKYIERDKELLYYMEICSMLGVNDRKKYIIKRSNETKTVFRRGNIPVIHLCIEDDRGIKFDEETVIIALIHEISHVLCNERGHTNKFYNIENEILSNAIKLRLITNESSVEENYPCRV